MPTLAGLQHSWACRPLSGRQLSLGAIGHSGSLDGAVWEKRALIGAKRLAHARWKESKEESPLFTDLFAPQLAATGFDAPAQEAIEADELELEMHTAEDIIATHYIDNCLMQAMEITNETRGDYKQVVLLGPGFDTRPFRLQWPPGTSFFSVAPTLVHDQMQKTLNFAAMKACQSPGCAYTPVNANFLAENSLVETLEATAYRGDRSSIWILQGTHGLGLAFEDLRRLIAEVSCSSSYHSLFTGELTGVTKSQAKALLAESGFLGAVLDYWDPDANYNRWPKASSNDFNPTGQGNSETVDRCGVLFSAQHQQLSLQEMSTYDAHVQAAEETDEDFFDNFS